MANYKFNLDILPEKINELYPVNFPVDNNPSMGAQNAFINFDGFMNSYLINGRIRGRFLNLPNQQDTYLFACTAFSLGFFSFYTTNLGVADDIDVSIEAVNITDFDAGTYTVLATIGSTTLTTASAEQELLGGLVIPNGLLVTIKPNVYLGSLDFYAFFLADSALLSTLIEGEAGGNEYLSYIALLSQSGGNAPVATELYNDIGPIVWSRNSNGNYSGILAGAFPINKTWAQITGGNATQKVESIVIPSNEIRIQSAQLAVVAGILAASFQDGILSATPLQIRVYP